MAKEDPYWAVSTAPQYRGGKWDPPAFFATGRSQVRDIMSYANLAGLSVKRGRALDFGCGLGRLTQALGDHFDEVLGIDIAPSMVEHAESLNPLKGKIRFLLNEVDSLTDLPTHTFDFVLSEITLMHMRPEYSKRYIADFLRVLRPGGVAVFQLPDPTTKQRIRAFIPHFLLDPALRLRAKKSPRMEIYGIKRIQIERLIIKFGASLGAVEEIREGHKGNRRYYVIA